MSQIEENVIVALQEIVFSPEIQEELATMIRERASVGLQKYGTTLADNNAPTPERLQHAIEELLDAANYLEWAGTDLAPEIELIRYWSLVGACQLLDLKKKIENNLG